jgi:uncharacterized protein with beta-barrel porin domain
LILVYGISNNSLGGAHIGDPSTGWTPFTFQKLNQMRLMFGLGITKNIAKSWSLTTNISHLFDGRNTDASDNTLAFSLVKIL